MDGRSSIDSFAGLCNFHELLFLTVFYANAHDYNVVWPGGPAQQPAQGAFGG